MTDVAPPSLSLLSSVSVVLLGAGGHARSLLGAVQDLEWPLRGCIAPERPAPDLWPHVLCPWLGDGSALAALDRVSLRLLNALGTIGPTGLRRRVYEDARQQGFEFASLLHPSVVLSGTVVLGHGVQVLAGAVVQNGARLGENALVNTGALIDHDCVIGAHAHLAPGVTLSGNVTVGDGAHIGTGATVIQGVRIGAGAVVGAGSLVLRDVPAGATVFGSPARLVRQAGQVS